MATLKDNETPCTDRGEEHCEHYHDWPMAADQDEPSGDPGDGLGVQGYCCQCPAEQHS